MIAFGSGESGGDGSPPGSSGGRGRSVSKWRVLCSFSFFTGFEGRVSFGLSNREGEKKKITFKGYANKILKNHDVWLLTDYKDFTFKGKNPAIYKVRKWNLSKSNIIGFYKNKSILRNNENFGILLVSLTLTNSSFNILP